MPYKRHPPLLLHYSSFQRRARISFRTKEGIRFVVTIVRLQPGKQIFQHGGKIINANLLRVGRKHRIFLAPHLVPVDFSLGLFADAVDHLLGLLLVKIVFDELIQRHVVEHGQPFGLANIRQCFVGFPFGNGLAAYA